MKNSLDFFEVLSTNFIEIPFIYKKASSLILFSSVEALNLMEEKFVLMQESYSSSIFFCFS